MASTRLYLVNGSHPCATVEKALELKGEPYKVFEFTPPAHALGMRLFFGPRTVPAIKFADGEKVSGSREILARLDERIPEPPLYGADPDERARIIEAERWGEEVIQPIARRVIWPAFARNPAAMHAFQEGSRLPALPLPAIKVAAPVVTRVERKMNDATDEATQADLQALPGYLDTVDEWIATGLLGGDEPNAADLQISATLRLLLTIEDIHPLFAGRPAEALASQYIAPINARIPAGTLPADWVPTPTPA